MESGDDEAEFLLCNRDFFGCDLELRWVFEVLLYCAQLCGTNQRRPVFFREGGWDLNLQVDLADHAGHAIGVHTLEDADAIGRQAALLAKAQHVDAGSRAERSEKDSEGGWGGTLTAAHRWLVGVDCIRIEVSVYGSQSSFP